MIDVGSLVPRTDSQNLKPPPQVRRQQRMMVVALGLLITALVAVLYRDRDFWFPDAQEADTQLPGTSPAASTSATGPASHHKLTRKSHQSQAKASAPAQDVEPPPVSVTRTVLPPLEVEVVAARTHRILHPGSNAIRLGTKEEAEPASSTVIEPAASVTTNAAEHVRVSAEPGEVVSHSVSPGYPMLARQMKVQGSVILQALIGRDGLVQDIHVLSGPPILATAAEEAVRQWHFKPHYQGGNAVETQTRVTVNFTISTN